MEKILSIYFVDVFKGRSIKLYGILEQIHLSLSNMTNANIIFGPVFVPCVRLVNHTWSAVYAFAKFSVFLIQPMSC